MLTKTTVIDKIEILESGTLQVRHATYIVEDGVRIAGPIYARQSFDPADPLPASADPLIAQIAAAVWTPARIDQARAAREASRRESHKAGVTVPTPGAPDVEPPVR